MCLKIVAPLSVQVRGDSNVAELSMLTLSCSMQAASVPPVVTWLRRRSDGEVVALLNTTRTSITVTNYNPMNGRATSVLTIDRVENDDEGVYICQVETNVNILSAATKTVNIPGKLKDINCKML